MFCAKGRQGSGGDRERGGCLPVRSAFARLRDFRRPGRHGRWLRRRRPSGRVAARRWRGCWRAFRKPWQTGAPASRVDDGDAKAGSKQRVLRDTMILGGRPHRHLRHLAAGRMQENIQPLFTHRRWHRLAPSRLVRAWSCLAGGTGFPSPVQNRREGRPDQAPPRRRAPEIKRSRQSPHPANRSGRATTCRDQRA